MTKEQKQLIIDFLNRCINFKKERYQDNKIEIDCFNRSDTLSNIEYYVSYEEAAIKGLSQLDLSHVETRKANELVLHYSREFLPNRLWIMDHRFFLLGKEIDDELHKAFNAYKDFLDAYQKRGFRADFIKRRKLELEKMIEEDNKLNKMIDLAVQNCNIQ